jgi:DNA-binding response OmpR family regulator
MGADKSPRRALLLEDNVAHARLVRALLEALDPPIQVHQSGRLVGALDRLSTETFDLIVTDLHLPDGQGPDVVARLNGEARGAPIVVVSALDDESTRLQALRNGAQDWLVKDRLSVELLGHAISLAVQRATLAGMADDLLDVDVRTGALTPGGLRRGTRRQVALSRRQKQSISVIHLHVTGLTSDQLDEFSRIAVMTARESDLVGRVGQDRLCLVLPDDKSDPPAILGRLEFRAREAGLRGCRLVPNVVRFDPDNPASPDELLAAGPSGLADPSEPRVDAPLRRVLLASADAGLCETVARELGGTWRTLVVQTAVQALRVAALEEPDLVLIDLGLPDNNATAIARTVTEQPESSDVPILGVGRPGEPPDADPRRGGYDRVLERSDLGVELHDAIRSILNLRQ